MIHAAGLSLKLAVSDCEGRDWMTDKQLTPSDSINFHGFYMVLSLSIQYIHLVFLFMFIQKGSPLFLAVLCEI